MFVSKFKKTLLLLISISATACPSGTDSENFESSLGLLLALAGSPAVENAGSSAETVSAPAFSPAPGTYTSNLSLTLSSTTPDATIRYTTDGSSPTCATGTEYSAPIPLAIPGTRTVKAIGCKTDWTASSVMSATYTQPSTAPQVLSISPTDGGNLDHWQSIVITFSESMSDCNITGNLGAIQYLTNQRPELATILYPLFQPKFGTLGLTRSCSVRPLIPKGMDPMFSHSIFQLPFSIVPSVKASGR